MFPAAFDYHRAETVDDVVAALYEHGDDAKLLAGGQSLLPLMKFRLATPGVLIDIGRVEALRGVRVDGDHLEIGAATTHQDVIDAPVLAARCGALAAVVRRIGDPQVRHRGTIGGAMAHGDAAGDLPALARALDAEFVLASQKRRRRVRAADFFTGHLQTVLAPEEVLLAVRVPDLAGWSWAYEKFAPVSHAWAVVGACALVRRKQGRIADVRVGLTHMGEVPLRATATEGALRGGPAEPAAIAAAAALADVDTSPPSDSNADAAFRRHLARVLTARALGRALDLDVPDPEPRP
ncbi:xanthine dehydrogenase family protein subunit M [Egicoccus sp. AB-alg6-2]|uniref:FAD binding domain-containing protein n=1 Tax=Egicoccus sp. AB-alg6-2 TaxID=3242692 RepID=UPI00359CED09